MKKLIKTFFLDSDDHVLRYSQPLSTNNAKYSNNFYALFI